MLLERARMHIGDDQVQAICNALVRAYFFCNNPVAEGQQWVGPPHAGSALHLLDPAQVNRPEHKDFMTKRHEDCALAGSVVALTGMTADVFSQVLKTYGTLFQWEMKQRGFTLEYHPHPGIALFGQQPGPDWWQLKALDP